MAGKPGQGCRFQISFLAQMINKNCIVTAIPFLTVSSPFAFAIEPENQSADRTAIEAFTRKFLRAFEDLDIQQFVVCFADDASVFFPVPEPPERVNGKHAIQQRFERVFASIRSTAKSGPPFHHLTAEELDSTDARANCRCIVPPPESRTHRAPNSCAGQYERAMAYPPSARF